MIKKYLKHLVITAAFAVSIFGLKQNVFAETVEINATNFPDQNLRDYLIGTVEDSFDNDNSTSTKTKSSDIGTYNPNTNVYTINTEKVTKIEPWETISDATGLDKFTELTILQLNSSIDINFDAFTKLKMLNWGGTYTNANLKNLNNLTYLSLYSTTCKSITLGDVSKIEYLSLGDVPLDNVNFNNFTSLNDLTLSNSSITSFTVVDAMANLEVLNLSECSSLSSIDISKAVKLNNLTISECPITSLDLSKCAGVRFVDVYRTSLSALDVSNNTKLRELEVRESGIFDLDVSNNTKLEELNISKTNIAALDITKNTKLRKLTANENKKLTKVTTGKNSKLIYIDISDSPVKKLSTSKLKKLAILYVNNTKISSLNLKNNKKLFYIDFSGSKIKKLNLKAQNNLTIYFDNVKMGSTLNLSKYLGTGYKIDSDAKKYDKVSYNSKTGKLKTSKKTEGAYVTLTKGKKTYYINVNYKSVE